MGDRPVIDREALRKILAKAYAAGMNRYNSGKISPPSEVRKLDEFTDAAMELARSEAEVKAEALREAAALGYYNSAWLRERADELEAQADTADHEHVWVPAEDGMGVPMGYVHCGVCGRERACPGCGEKITSDRYVLTGVCRDCWGTTDDPR